MPSPSQFFFPDLESPDSEIDADGLVAVGGELTTENLCQAYRQGIFPWPDSHFKFNLWFSPDPRAILEFNQLRLGRTLQKVIKKNAFTCTIDRAFEDVIRSCRVAKRKEKGTWITPPMIEAYLRLHREGHAHSVEVWQGTSLVGGMYGVSVDGTFAGESMFHLRDNASKVALVHLVQHLESKGLEWMDIQMLTPHLERLGAIEIPRREFLKRLRLTQSKRMLF